MVLHGVEDCDKDADGALGVVAARERGLTVGARGGGVRVVAAGEEGAGEVADGGYDYGEVIAAVPETVVGGLVAEDLLENVRQGKRLRARDETYEHETEDDGESGDL